MTAVKPDAWTEGRPARVTEALTCRREDCPLCSAWPRHAVRSCTTRPAHPLSGYFTDLLAHSISYFIWDLSGAWGAVRSYIFFPK